MTVRYARKATPRAPGSWDAAIVRACEAWDKLAGPRGRPSYSETAAAAILSTAVALWSDTAALLNG